MESLASFATQLWNAMPPTTWIFILGILVSIHLVRKALF